MQIGRRIYYDKSTGEVIVDTGERSGDVVETTIDQDFMTYISLLERSRESVGMVQLDYGAYAADFSAGAMVSKIDLNNLTPLFVYPTPDEPSEPQPSLSQKVDDIEKRQDLMQEALDNLLMGGL